MHPLFVRPRRLLIYLGLWLAFGFGLAAALVLVTPRPYGAALAFTAPLSVIYGLICLSAWWVCRQHPLSRGDVTGAIGAQVIAAAQSAGAWLAFAGILAVTFAHSGVGPPREALVRDFVALLIMAVPLYLISAAVHYLVLALEASHDAAQRVLASQVAAREAELRALRAQLNPHFLFNSLNSINALIGSDPEGARRMCEGLGDFLRRTLQLGARDAVTLREELALVDRYLGIEQVRFAERLRVERAIDPAALDCLLPPLLLQPLVENAIKHGVANRVEGGTLHLEAAVRAGTLIVELENPVDDDAPARPGAGLGLDNVRRRLMVLGARDASLQITRGAQSFRATLTLAARHEAAADPAMESGGAGASVAREISYPAAAAAVYQEPSRG